MDTEHRDSGLNLSRGGVGPSFYMGRFVTWDILLLDHFIIATFWEEAVAT